MKVSRIKLQAQALTLPHVKFPLKKRAHTFLQLKDRPTKAQYLSRKISQTEHIRPSADKTIDKRNPISETDLKQQAAKKSTFINREVNPSEEVSEQRNLIGITQENSTSSVETEEDLLDIPAFLREAN